MKKWYVVKTKVNQEKRALTNLSNQGFEIFCPVMPMLRKFKNTVSNIINPLFPSYIFVRFDVENDNWIKIKNTYGVKEILKNSSMYPGSISSVFINNLRKMCDSDNCINDNYFNFKIGQKVRYVDGPFLNKIVEIIRIHKKNRILVLQKIFSQHIKISVSQNKITPA